MGVLEYIGSIGGITGILAFLIFTMYKQAIAQMREDRKFMEDRLTIIIQDYNKICEANRDALVKHTQIQTELIVYLKAKNGSRL